MEEHPSSTEKSYQELYQAGISSFEHGEYQRAIAQFQQALSAVNEKTKIGGEIQVWLANAYDAVGNSTEAIALCRRLKTHSDRDVRKSANYVLGILSAPQLNQLQDAVTKIPSLKSISEQNSPSVSVAASGTQSPSLKSTLETPAADPNGAASFQQNNRFILTVLVVTLTALVVWAVK